MSQFKELTQENTQKVLSIFKVIWPSKEFRFLADKVQELYFRFPSHLHDKKKNI